MGEMMFISGPNVKALSLSLTDKDESSDDSPEVKKPNKKLVCEIYQILQAGPPSLTQLQEVLGEDDTIVHLSSDEPKEADEVSAGADESYDNDNESETSYDDQEEEEALYSETSYDDQEEEEALYSETSYDDQEEEEALYSPQAGDTVQIKSADPAFICYVVRVDKKKGDNIHCRWYYYPEETKEGRKPFHGVAEVFSSDHKTVQSVETVIGKCTVHSIEDYNNLEREATDSDFYSRFHYDNKTGAYSPDTIEVFCTCKMPQNPDCVMTQCNGCSEWFHKQCMPLTYVKAKGIQKCFCEICSELRKRRITNKMYLDMEIDGVSAGRIIVGLFGKTVPKTANTFKALCRGDKGVGTCCKPLRGKPLHYKGTAFYRIYPGKAIHGGRILRDDGSGYEQIKLDYESCDIKPKQGSIFALVTPPYTTGSEFSIAMDDCNDWAGKCVTFGEIISGMDVLVRIGSEVDCGVPKKSVIVGDCGELCG